MVCLKLNNKASCLITFFIMGAVFSSFVCVCGLILGFSGNILDSPLGICCPNDEVVF